MGLSQAQASMHSFAAQNLALLVTSVFSSAPKCFSWFENNCSAAFGQISLSSPFFDFSETDYYSNQMGNELKLRLYAFSPLIQADSLADLKHRAIVLERSAKEELNLALQRPINIDPGYLTGAKYVLASTKDGSHRISLGQDIFAEITLMYRYGAWVDSPWTYPNYRREDYKAFLSQARALFLQSGQNLECH